MQKNSHQTMTSDWKEKKNQWLYITDEKWQARSDDKKLKPGLNTDVK